MSFDKDDIKHLADMKDTILDRIDAKNEVLHERISSVRHEVQEVAGGEQAQDVEITRLKVDLAAHQNLNGKAHSIELLHMKAVQHATDVVGEHVTEKHTFIAFCKLVGMAAGLITGIGFLWKWMHGAF